MKNKLLLIIIFVNLIFANDQIPGKKQVRAIAITNAKIFTVTNGIIENGTILFEKGKIVSIGKNIELQKDIDIVDANGGFVYPGLISSLSQVGMVEIQAVRATVDLTEVGKFNPNVRAEITLNPDSDLLPTVRANGILLANVLPTGNIISGKSSVIMLDGWTQEDLILKSETGMVLQWPQMRTVNMPWIHTTEEEQKKEREKSLKEINDFISDAKAYKIAKEVKQNIKTDLKYESMINVLNKKTPLIVFANDVLQIEAAVEFCENENLKMILAGGKEAWQIGEKLKKKNIPVLIGQVYDTPNYEWENYNTVYTNSVKLFNAGVTIAIAAEGEAMSERNLPFQAGSTIPFGLSKEEALKSITINPAEILGVSDKVGSLEIGKDATLFISDGDIFEIPTQINYAFIQGKKVDLETKHTILHKKYVEKYRQLKIIK